MLCHIFVKSLISFFYALSWIKKCLKILLSIFNISILVLKVKLIKKIWTFKFSVIFVTFYLLPLMSSVVTVRHFCYFPDDLQTHNLRNGCLKFHSKIVFFRCCYSVEITLTLPYKTVTIESKLTQQSVNKVQNYKRIHINYSYIEYDMCSQLFSKCSSNLISRNW